LQLHDNSFLAGGRPLFTGERRDVNFHGWLELSDFGRAKITDGTLVAFDEFPPMQGML
jgi:hypothetical protein